MCTVEVRIEHRRNAFSRNKIKAYASGLNHGSTGARGLATVGCRGWQRGLRREKVGFHQRPSEDLRHVVVATHADASWNFICSGASNSMVLPSTDQYTFAVYRLHATSIQPQ